MPRLIDAGALIAEMHNVILEDGEDRRIFYEVIERQPTIAQPEIIRCRDCKLRDTEYCNMAHGFMGMKDDDYCSYAERREVEP